MTSLEEFLDCRDRNAWVRFHWGEAYLRKSVRGVPGETGAVHCLDMANVEVKEECRQQGHFTRFMSELEEICQAEGKVLYVENALSDWVKRVCEKRRYFKKGMCYFWVPPRTKLSVWDEWRRLLRG